LSIRERDRAFGRRGFDLRIEADLGARGLGALRQQGDDVLPVDPVRAARGLARHHHVAMRVHRIAAIDPHAAGEHAFKNAEGREDARHVVVDGDAVAFAAQRVPPFVHAHRPAALGQGDGGNEAAETGSDNLDVSGLHRVLRLRRAIVARVRHKRKRPPAGELPEAAVSAVRSRDTNGGREL
jgi:hypothetical protein